MYLVYLTRFELALSRLKVWCSIPVKLQVPYLPNLVALALTPQGGTEVLNIKKPGGLNARLSKIYPIVDIELPDKYVSLEM